MWCGALTLLKKLFYTELEGGAAATQLPRLHICLGPYPHISSSPGPKLHPLTQLGGSGWGRCKRTQRGRAEFVRFFVQSCILTQLLNDDVDKFDIQFDFKQTKIDI